MCLQDIPLGSLLASPFPDLPNCQQIGLVDNLLGIHLANRHYFPLANPHQAQLGSLSVSQVDSRLENHHFVQLCNQLVHHLSILQDFLLVIQVGAQLDLQL